MKITQRVKTAAKVLFKGADIESANENWQELLDFLGIDRQNTPRSALANATYFACLKTLSEAIGKMPLKILSYGENRNGVIECRDNPYWQMLHDRPNRYMTATNFWSLMEYNRNHYGNGYAWIVYDAQQRKTELFPLEPWRVELWYDDSQLLADKPMLWYRYSGAGRTVMIPYDSMLHVRNFATKNGLTGQSVRSVLAESIEGNIKSQKLLNKMYDNGFAGKAAIQYTGELNDELEKRFIKGIEKYIKGEYKADGIDMLIPLPYMAKIENLSNIRLADSQFLELKQYSALQIAAAFGIKPVQIGDYTKSSYASAEAQQLSFLIDTLLYIIKQYEEEINYKILSGDCFAKFNVDVILRADFRNKIETLSTAVNSFLMTPNEARSKCDLGALPGGDKLVGNGSAIPLTEVGAQYSERG